MINLWAKSHSSWRKFCNLGRKQKFYLTAFVSYVKQKACETACTVEWGTQNAK